MARAAEDTKSIVGPGGGRRWLNVQSVARAEWLGIASSFLWVTPTHPASRLRSQCGSALEPSKHANYVPSEPGDGRGGEDRDVETKRTCCLLPHAGTRPTVTLRNLFIYFHDLPWLKKNYEWFKYLKHLDKGGRVVQ